MFINKLVLIFIFLFGSYLICAATEIRIISKIDNEIITNIDLDNQIKYLFLINKKLKNLNELELLELSKNSIIKEIIKKKEVNKFIKVQENINLKAKLIKEHYLSLGFKNESEYLNFLNQEGVNYNIIKEKILVEKLWNVLIYEKFNKKAKIDKSEISNKVNEYFKNQEKLYEVELSEILFDYDVDYDEVANFIDMFGFESAVAKFSISNSASNGGKIGWVNINNLSKEIQKKISFLSVGKYTDPIKLPEGKLILMVNSKKEIKKTFDIDKEVKKQILFEQNRQLNSYSMNYFKKLKKNTIFNDY